MIVVRLTMIFIICAISCGVSCQENALIIKHTGVSDATIYPVVFSPDSITEEFTNKYLKYLKNFTIPPKYVVDIEVSTAELSEIGSLVCRLAKNINDTTKYTYRKGNFDIIWVVSGKIEKKISINNMKKSYAFLSNLLVELDNTFNSYIEAYNAIEYLIEQLNPNPTKEIIPR